MLDMYRRRLTPDLNQCRQFCFSEQMMKDKIGITYWPDTRIVHERFGFCAQPMLLYQFPIPLLLSAEATVNWDRDDIFLVIANEDKKNECDSIPPIERILSESQTCKAGDSEFEVVGENGTTGLTWAPEDGEYYVGIGTLGENNPAGEGFNLEATIELNLSASGYVLTLLFGAIGVQLVRND